MNNRKIAIEVVDDDAIHYDSDVLVLKYAQDLFGLDRAVVSLIEHGGKKIQHDLPNNGDYLVLDAPEIMAPAKVIFIGTPRLRNFGYKEIREFGRRSISSLSTFGEPVNHISLTIHGAGYGLDVEEAFSSQLAGMVDAVHSGQFPADLQRITFLERAPRRGPMLQRLLDEVLPGSCIDTDPRSMSAGGDVASRQTLREAGYTSENKPLIFVAMPFKEDMEDVWEYGINRPVKSAHYLCERADSSHFTGDVMDWVRKRIKDADLVIADLTESNPNVYLEVGYAWGVGVPTILVMNNETKPEFDVQGQRCHKYKIIKDLEKLLEAELAGLKKQNNF